MPPGCCNTCEGTPPEGLGGESKVLQCASTAVDSNLTSNHSPTPTPQKVREEATPTPQQVREELREWREAWDEDNFHDNHIVFMRQVGHICDCDICVGALVERPPPCVKI